MRYKLCDLNAFPVGFNELQKSIHQFNLDEDTLNLGEAYLTDDEIIFPDEFFAVNLDDLEALFNKHNIDKGKSRNKRKSMDMGFLVIDEKGQEIAVLVEYRLAYKSPKNIDPKELEDKVRWSSRLVRHCFKRNIHMVQYFVFAKDKYPMMRRKINDMKRESNDINQFEAVTIQMLFDKFFT